MVTDIGGVLSHGSIVAREYGIPAVLGTGSATRRIATGDVVTVDGPGAAVRLADAPDPVEIGRPRWPLAVAGGVAVGVGVLAWRRLAITCRP